jgi:hypothetical protein
MALIVVGWHALSKETKGVESATGAMHARRSAQGVPPILIRTYKSWVSISSYFPPPPENT